MAERVTTGLPIGRIHRLLPINHPFPGSQSGRLKPITILAFTGTQMPGRNIRNTLVDFIPATSPTLGCPAVISDFEAMACIGLRGSTAAHFLLAP